MMDVILRNDPHVMDFNEYWDADDVYTESAIQSIGKALKKLWETFLRLVRQIRTRIKNVINKDARTYREMTAMLNDPEKVETLKSTMVYKHDYEGIRASLSKGIVLCHIVLQFATFVKSNASRIDADGHVNWTENDKSEMNKIIGDLVTVTKELKALTEWKPKEPVKDGCTGYEAILEWKEIYLLSKAYFASHDNVVKITDEFNDLLNDCPGDSVELLKKIVAKWCEGFSYVDKIGTHMGAGLNARVDVWKELKKGGTPVKESYELDELNAYIEYTMNDLHEALELRNELIQESDDDTVEDFEESDDNFADDYEEAEGSIWPDPKPGVNRSKQINDFDKKYHVSNSTRHKLNKMNDEEKYDNVNSDDTKKAKKSLENRMSHIKGAKKDNGNYKFNEYYSDAIIRNYDEPVEEETTYRLRSNDMFTESYDDESYGPSRFYQEAFPAKYVDSALDAGLNLRIATRVFVILGAINTICTSLIYNKSLGRFPSEMKRVMDIIKKSKDGTVNTSDLYRALGDLKHATKTIVGQHAISYKAKKNFTQTEREEMKKLINIISDLENMLTSKKYQAAERRVAARIEDFVTQADKVMKLINRGRNEGDVVKEYMS